MFPFILRLYTLVAMSVISKLTFIPFTPHCTSSDAIPQTYKSDRDSFRGELRSGLNAKFGEYPRTPISGVTLMYTKL